MYSLDGQPKTVEEALDRMQFFQHPRQGRPPKPKRDVRAVAPEEEPQGTGNGRPSREIKDLQSRLKKLERALQERLSVQSNPTQNTLPPRAAVEERSSPACYKCGEVGHYRRNCPHNSEAKVTGNPQTKGANGQRSGTGDRAPRGPRTVRVLILERVERTPAPQDPRVFAPRCLDRESDPPDSDSAGTQASIAPPLCLRGKKKRPRLRVQFQRPPPQCCSHQTTRLFPWVRRSVRRRLAA